MMRVSYRRAEDVRSRTPQLERSFRGDRLDVCDATDAVRSKKPSWGGHTLGLETFEGGAPCSCRGFFSTFLLMRYHRAHARSRQVTFGLQSFVTISLIVFMVKKELAESTTEFINAQIAFKNAIVANGNLAGFLGNHYGDGIGFLAQSEGCAVAEAKVAIQILALGKGKNAGCRHHAVVVNDESSIV